MTNQPYANSLRRHGRVLTTKSEWAYEEVRQMILTGELEPGATINQEELAAKLEISVTPLREALRRLEGEGFASLSAHRTLTINELSAQNLDDIYALRLLLDPFAVSLATARMSNEQVALVSRLAKARPRGSPTDLLAANHEFHRAVYSASGNSLLTRALDQLWSSADRYRLALLSRGASIISRVDAEHLEIAEAVASRDAQAAEALMRKHVQTTLSWLKELLEGHSLDRGRG
jgi:DNA-binding GntR family transcriptional regulator